MTSKIEGLQKMNYHQRLYHLQQYSMQRRRERFAAIYMFKIATGLVPNNLNLNFYETKRHGLKCRSERVQRSQLHLHTIRRAFFTHTGPSVFNILPRDVKEAKTLESFKTKLDAHLKQIPALPPLPGYPCYNHNTLLEWATGRHNYSDIFKTLLTERGSSVKPVRSWGATSPKTIQEVSRRYPSKYWQLLVLRKSGFLYL